MADYSIQISQLPLLGASKASSVNKTVWRRWNQLSRLQRNIAFLVLAFISIVCIYFLTQQHPQNSAHEASTASNVVEGLERVAPAGPPLAEKPAKQVHRVVGKSYAPGEQHLGANIEHQLEESLDAAGNRVERVNKVVHLHRVEKVGEDLGDDDPSGVRHPPDPDRDPDPEQERQQVQEPDPDSGPAVGGRPQSPEQLVPLPVRRSAMHFPGPTNERQKAVVGAFKHAWKAYSSYAWGRDHLKPISKQGHDWFGLGLTLIDSLDTMYIMNLMDGK